MKKTEHPWWSDLWYFQKDRYEEENYFNILSLQVEFLGFHGYFMSNQPYMTRGALEKLALLNLVIFFQTKEQGTQSWKHNQLERSQLIRPLRMLYHSIQYDTSNMNQFTRYTRWRMYQSVQNNQNSTITDLYQSVMVRLQPYWINGLDHSCSNDQFDHCMVIVDLFFFSFEADHSYNIEQ